MNKKYSYLESDSNCESDFNLVSSGSDSDSNFSSVFMNLYIFVFFDLNLHSPK